uniref:ETS domain-containing protein n=1 Tax=Ascaris lumbricoides TaxID=6252 RepID=A0A0M3IJS7_ASCLU
MSLLSSDELMKSPTKASGFLSQNATTKALSPSCLQMSLPLLQDHLIFESDLKRSVSANSHVDNTCNPTNTQLKRSVCYGRAQQKHPDAFDHNRTVDMLADATTPFSLPCCFGSRLLPASTAWEAHLDSKTPHSTQPSANAFHGHMPNTVYLTSAPNITTSLSSDCNQQFLHALSATSESFSRNDSAPSSIWKPPMSFVGNGNHNITGNQVESNQLQLPLPTNNERAFFLKGCSSAALWNYFIECLIEPNDYGKVCAWTNLWEVSIRNTQLFTRNWNAYNPNKTKKDVSYMSLSRALKTFENTKWCGWVLLKKVPGRRSTYRFLPDHNSPMLPPPKENTPVSFTNAEQPRRSSLLANNYYMSIEIGGKKRVRGKTIDEEPTLEEKMGIFRSKKQRIKYLRNISLPKTDYFFEHNENALAKSIVISGDDETMRRLSNVQLMLDYEMTHCNNTLSRTTSDLCSSSATQLQQQFEHRDNILEGNKVNGTSNSTGKSNNKCNLRADVGDFGELASALSGGISIA